MKALAMAGIRQMEATQQTLNDYAANLDLALQAVLRLQRFADAPPDRIGPTGAGILPPPPGAPVGVILFGSEHGLCGSFNERIIGFARQELHRRGIPLADCRIAAVGARLAALMQDGPLPARECFPLPSAVEGATDLLQDLLLLIEQWRFGSRAARWAEGAHPAGGVGRVLLIFHRCERAARHHPTAWQLLPLDAAWIRTLRERPWLSNSQPASPMAPEPLFSAIVREHLHLTLMRCTVDSLASENVARLQAMQAAETHIEDRLAELRTSHRQQRQNEITAELLDIVAGFEALRS
jgi:F-type H+-transporting ATPase subunit gamma